MGFFMTPLLNKKCGSVPSANMTARALAALAIDLLNPMEGPTFANHFPSRGQLFV